jgi:hypothetical protein
MLPKEVSDHNPLRVAIGMKKFKEPMVMFEKWWLEIEDFSEVVKKA